MLTLLAEVHRNGCCGWRGVGDVGAVGGGGSRAYRVGSERRLLAGGLAGGAVDLLLAIGFGSD